MTGHSPLMCSLFSKSKGTRDKSLWKRLYQKSKNSNRIKQHIATLEILKKENITYEQNLWEYLKKEIENIQYKRLVVLRKSNLQLQH